MKIHVFLSRKSYFNKHAKWKKKLTFNIKVHALLVPADPARSFTVIPPGIGQLHFSNVQGGASTLPFDFDTAIWALLTSRKKKGIMLLCEMRSKHLAFMLYMVNKINFYIYSFFPNGNFSIFMIYTYLHTNSICPLA